LFRIGRSVPSPASLLRPGKAQEREHLNPDLEVYWDPRSARIGGWSHQAEIKFIVVAGRVEDALDPRPEVPHVDGVVPFAMAKFLLLAGNDQSDETVCRNPSVLLESDGIPDLGADPVGADDQVGFNNLAGLEREAAVRVGGDGLGVHADLDPDGAGAIDQRVMKVAPGHDAPG
jgi:hypothetical protein